MRKKRKKQIRWIVFLISIFAVMSTVIGSSLAKIKREGTNYYKSQMETIVKDHAEKINTELSKLEASGKTAANMLTVMETPQEKAIVNVIISVLSGTDASRVIYHEGDGIGWEWDGFTLKEIDLTQYSYYNILQNAGGVTYTYFAKGNGADAVIVVIPIGGDVKRDLVVYYPMEKINDLLRITTEFDTNSFAVLLDENGTIITKSNYESSFLSDVSFRSSLCYTLADSSCPSWRVLVWSLPFYQV